MSKIFIFDVDGTLTPSRRKMAKDFKDFFSEWIKKNKFYLVTGSDLPKLQEQMDFMEIHAEGIFTCCGNQFWQPDPAVHPKHCDLIYENEFKIPEKLEKLLEVFLMTSPYHHRAGNHIEDRDSMLNFSVVGRNCSLMERDNYFKYDNEEGERKKLSTIIKHKFPELDAVIGGQISIDIYPKGNDKSQILDIIKQDRLVEADEYIFIGDRTMKGGNDYPLARLMKNTDNCSYYQTGGWNETQNILENLSD
tara:strand:+ start:594 stop:1340 length:747 start_codon:yes stop_codon:yes gene_type:complete